VRMVDALNQVDRLVERHVDLVNGAVLLFIGIVELFARLRPGAGRQRRQNGHRKAGSRAATRETKWFFQHMPHNST